MPAGGLRHAAGRGGFDIGKFHDRHEIVLAEAHVILEQRAAAGLGDGGRRLRSVFRLGHEILDRALGIASLEHEEGGHVSLLVVGGPSWAPFCSSRTPGASSSRHLARIDPSLWLFLSRVWLLARWLRKTIWPAA